MATKKLDLKSLSSMKKIQSPLAKYNGLGQLFCVLCNTQVKNESVWTAHVNGKQHREGLQNLKSGKKRPNPEESPTPAAKKPAISRTSESESKDFVFKKPTTQSPTTIPKTNVPIKKSNAQIFREMESMDAEAMDFEAQAESSHFSKDAENADSPEKNTDSEASESLPEGFFDDPKLDAKARGLEFKNPDEIEWENFVKEIAGEEAKSTGMRVEDEEESAKARELEEIEEQMAHWQKVIDLEKKAQELRNSSTSKSQQSNPNQNGTSTTTSNPKMDKTDSDSDDNLEYDEDLDWRAKKNR